MGQESKLAHSMSRGKPWQHWYFLFVAITLTAVTYLGTLRFDFVYDDNGQIRDNPFIKSWHYLPQYFVSSAWKHLLPLAGGTYYRPLFLTWLRLNYALFSLHPFGWHATSVMLHLLVTWLVYSIVCKLTRRPNLACLTALIFGLHPVHHEVVAWISGPRNHFSRPCFWPPSWPICTHGRTTERAGPQSRADSMLSHCFPRRRRSSCHFLYLLIAGSPMDPA